MRSERKFVLAVVAGVLAAGLAGCTSGGEKTPSPSGGSSSSASSPSGSASPTSSGSASGSASASTAVEVPEAARANTPEGATEFAKWYLLQGAQANVDLDSTVLKTYSMPECVTCKAVIQGVEDLKTRGEHEREARFTPGASQVGPGSDSTQYVVDILGSYAAGDVLDSSGKTVRTLPVTEGALRVTTVWRDGWRIQEVSAIQT